MSLALFDSLFGSKARSRLIRFFLLNPGAEFTTSEVSEKTLIPRGEASRELVRLTKMRLVIEHTRKGKKSFSVNEDFPCSLAGSFSTIPRARWI